MDLRSPQSHHMHRVVAPKAHLHSSAKDGPRVPWFFCCPRVRLILGFSEMFEFLLTEKRCVPIDSEATIGPVAATCIVSKTLKKKFAGEVVWSTKSEVTSSETFSKSGSGQIAPDWDFAQIFVYFRKTSPSVALTGKGSTNERSSMASRSFIF